jgi:hypothetical protein
VQQRLPAGTFLPEYYTIVLCLSWIACAGATLLWIMLLINEVPDCRRFHFLWNGRTMRDCSHSVMQGIEKAYTQRLRFMFAMSHHRRHAMGVKSVAVLQRGTAQPRKPSATDLIPRRQHSDIGEEQIHRHFLAGKRSTLGACANVFAVMCSP